MTDVPPTPTNKGGWKDFVAGNFAGMSQVIVGQPLDTIKVRLQLESTRFKGPMDCFMQTVKNEGFFALYKGMAAPLVGIGAVNALLFAAYSRLKSIQATSLNEQLALHKIALAGAGAGLINSVLSSPVELLKIKMQAQYGSSKAKIGTGELIYKGPIDCARHLISEFGIRNGLFRGFWATVAREIPAYAGFYSGFEYFKRKLTPEGSNPDILPPSKLMLAGSFGGFSYWLCCYPLDVVKSKVQNMKNPPKGVFYVFTTISSIYKTEGARAFTRGITPTIKENLNLIREELRKFGNGSIEFNSSFSPGIGLIILHNSERHNALSGKMMAELADIVDKLELITLDKTNSKQETELIALILSGDGNTFCSGLDLSVAKNHILTKENGKKMSSLMQDTLLRFSRLPLISIAAIEGHALGGGAELTTACDHRCISVAAKIRFVQVKMGITTGWGGGGRLINIIGKTKSLRILGASEVLTGQQAYDIGYADIIAENETMNLYTLRFRVIRRSGISQCLARSQQIRSLSNTLERKEENVDTKEIINDWKAKVTNDVDNSVDTITATPLQLLTISLRRKYIIDDLLATQIPPKGTRIPQNYHLAYFPPKVYESELENDGTESRYAPPPPFSRRMWAGGELSFSANNPLRVGQQVSMNTKCREVNVKSNPKGENIFLWLDRDISNELGWSMRETRCIVYMKTEEKKPEQRIIKLNKVPDFEQTIFPTSLLLFRFSALTFNSHRIHYDHSYVTQTEKYSGCLVHGPLTLTLLVDLMRDNLPNKTSFIKTFTHRAVSPLFVDEEFKVCGKRSESDDPNNNSYELWAENKHGGVAMKATAILDNI
ncbi:9706_t:CDS:10 [Funneliformis geosporum]|uniref:9706_t:CDS:1 n=1 Tax=Funneliformis geosporum TaxID=1117311 RepID=A0A9W4SRW0_9GLOM|nr:9706_t:CDS:10 [Funneliformis geosporum]